MSAFFDYIRNITYYLMFVALIGMLAPAGKYKKFVSLVMGFTLIAVMIFPLANLGRGIPVTDWFAGITVSETASAETSYTQWRNTYLRDAFETQLRIQLEALLTQNGFSVHSATFTYDDDFSRLTSVAVTVSRDEITERVPFIRIQPVQPIQIGGTPQPQTCAVATDAKNLISQFYNLPVEHINVIVK